MKINLLLIIFISQLNLILSIFVHIFIKLSKKNITIESAVIVENLEEVVLCYKRGLKENIRKFVFSDSLSEAYFLEVN